MFHPLPASIPRARVADIATFAPAGRLTNADIAKMVETSDEWIVQRTGIRERSISAADQYASDLCLEAVRRLRERVGSLDRVDTVIAATSTADYVFPSLAAQIQFGANLPHAGAFDVGAACAGFPYAINIASALVASGQAREVLVVGGEVMTKALDYTDRSTCILFGDGAGAALVVPADERSYIERCTYGCDGEGGKYLYRTNIRHARSPERKMTPGLLRQSGSDVYKWQCGASPSDPRHARRRKLDTRRHRLVHSAQCQPAHRRGALRAHRNRSRTNAHEHRELREYLNRVDSAGLDAGARRRPHQTRRPPPSLWFRRRSGPRWYAVALVITRLF